MRVRISYVVDLTDDRRRAMNNYYGLPGMADRERIKTWYLIHGLSMDDDLDNSIQYMEDDSDNE